MSRNSDQQRSLPPPQRALAPADAEFGASNACTTSSADILTEDIDQAVLHFTAAVKENNQPIITRTVLFMNEVLVSTAWRARCYRDEEEESEYAMQSGVGGRGRGAASGGFGGLHQHGRLGIGVPSLSQWVDALESLTAAALPTALKYLRDLYQLSTTWTQADRRCSLAVLNLVFFILVLCRQTQRRVAARRLRHQRQTHQQFQQQQHQQQQRASCVASPSSTTTPFFLEVSHTAAPAASSPSPIVDGRPLDTLESRVEGLYQAQQAIVVRYLCFIAWNAEAQLHTVKVSASVRIQGMPLLSELPQVPLYLSEYDGWIWVWMTAVLYSTLNLQRTHDASSQPSHGARASASTTAGPAATPSGPGRTSGAATASAGSPPPATTQRSSAVSFNVPPPVDSGRTSPSARHESTGEHGAAAASGGAGAASSVEEPLTGPAGATGNTQPLLRSAAVCLLLQMSAHDDGAPYAHKLVAVTLSSFELFLHHWTREQPVLGDLFREWTQRIVHSRLSPHVASLSRLYTLFDLILNGSLEELTRVVVTLDDIVVHTSFLFFSSTRPLLRLHQLLEQLVPLQVTLLLLYQLHPEAHRGALVDEEDGETTGDFRSPDEADDEYSSGVPSRQTERRRGCVHEVCADAVLGYCTAVSQLLVHVAELLLEPHTQHTNGFNAFQLPQSLCSAMLKNTMMFMASEIMLNEEFWLSVRGAAMSGSGGGRSGNGGGAAMRKQWRWWAVWTNTAHFVCVTGGRFGEMEESDTDLLSHQRRRDVFYVQAISLAMEDVYALLQMIASTDTTQSPVAPRTLSLVFQRLRMFFVRLHEEHLAAINLHVVSPFSALRDGTFNAFAQILEHYVAVTAMERAPFLASFASFSGTHLLRSTTVSNVLPAAPGSPHQLSQQQQQPSVPTPTRHRSLWLLAVAYLRLATIDASAASDGDAAATPLSTNTERRPGETAPSATTAPPPRRHLLFNHNFVCATPFVSLFYLRDRSYESSEDWMQQPNKWQKNILSRGGNEVPQLRDSAHLFRCYRGEVQQTEDAARELLLLASVRLLSAAVRAASRAQAAEEAERLNRSSSSFTNIRASSRGAESQAAVYVTAFSRYLCMLRDISTPCLLFLLQSIRDELRGCKEREGSTRQSNASAVTGEGNGNNWLGEQDLLDARAFEWEVSLYSV